MGCKTVQTVERHVKQSMEVPHSHRPLGTWSPPSPSPLPRGTLSVRLLALCSMACVRSLGSRATVLLYADLGLYLVALCFSFSTCKMVVIVLLAVRIHCVNVWKKVAPPCDKHSHVNYFMTHISLWWFVLYSLSILF